LQRAKNYWEAVTMRFGRLSFSETRGPWLNSYHAEKEETQEVQRDERGKSSVEGRIGDASAGKARGEQEALQERQAQTQSGQTAG
jgi:hypothetical protein